MPWTSDQHQAWRDRILVCSLRSGSFWSGFSSLLEDKGRLQKKPKPEEIVAKLRQVDVLVSQGQSVAEAVRSIGVTPFT